MLSVQYVKQVLHQRNYEMNMYQQCILSNQLISTINTSHHLLVVIMSQCIENSLHLVMRPHNLNPDTKQLNYFRFTELSFEDIAEQLAEVFRMHDEAFKLNISFGFMMTHLNRVKTNISILLVIKLY